MLYPTPDLYTLINVCAGAYRDEPEFSARVLEAFCACVAARGGNTDRLRALYVCGMLPTVQETAMRMVQEPARTMEFIQEKTDAWKRVLSGLDGINDRDHVFLMLTWETRMRLFEIMEPPGRGTVLSPTRADGQHRIVRAAYKASNIAASRVYDAARDGLASIDAHLFGMLTNLPTPTPSVRPASAPVPRENEEEAQPFPVSNLVAAGFPTDAECSALFAP